MVNIHSRSHSYPHARTLRRRDSVALVYRLVRRLDHGCLLTLQAQLLSRPFALVAQCPGGRQHCLAQAACRSVGVLLLVADCLCGILRDLLWAATLPAVELCSGMAAFLQLLRQGEVKQAIFCLVDSLLSFLFSVVGRLIDQLLRLARTLFDCVDTIVSGRAQIPLSVSQQQMLQKLFGSSLSYSLVRISYGCPSLRLMTAHVAGNVMVLPPREQLVSATGELNAAGLSLLFHEATHVWQHHNGGGSYMHRALAAQLYSGIRSGQRGHAYDWRRGLRHGVVFERLNPEQQAQLVQEIAVGLFDRQSQGVAFETDDEQKFADRALLCLQSGSCLA